MLHITSAQQPQAKEVQQEIRGFSAGEPKQPKMFLLYFCFPNTDASTKMQASIIALFLSSEEARITDTVC